MARRAPLSAASSGPVRRRALLLAALLPALLSLAGCPTPDKPQSECTGDADCSGGATCLGDDDDVRVCALTCGADNPCGAGYACVETSGGPGCFRLQDNLENGAPCTADTQCASGACVGEQESQRCVELCAEDLSCSDGDRCYLVGPRRVCLSPLENRTTGEACDTPRQCASGRCVNMDHVEGGAFCVDGCSEEEPCEGELVCARLEIGAQVCVPGAADGTACTTPDICVNGRCIIDVDDEALCTGPCADDGSCAEGWLCVEDSEGAPICMPTLDDRAAGEACESARECATGICARFGDHGTLCAAPCGDEDACPEGQVCWQSDAGGLCGPMP